jgi:hypothetical protein
MNKVLGSANNLGHSICILYMQPGTAVMAQE